MSTRLPSLARHLARRTTSLRATSHPTMALPLQRAAYSSSSSPRDNPFASYPAPPRLPAAEQAEFERLQRSANTQEPLDPVAAEAATASQAASSSSQINPDPQGVQSPVAAEALTNRATLGETSNLPLRRGAPPEFEGDVNPKTGEVGGPKNEPLRWGHAGDWSYNGRVTDF
ncbi:hypothetical protein JX265_009335 [Neoarthrinium moseri]|uniref:Succinate dehydrogenase assembly factor 4, mitochondrial n=1 Tax=Neoarthrinium moseri TaxID=1658444 RepID=A0A9Q0AMP1_9PEZI|nr:hypothetical protein JX265_009335 [Neoarthrinium moseri]